MDGLTQTSVGAIGRITSVPMILDLVCSVTGMRFSVVARVTTDRWIACRVHGDIHFGLRPGDELAVTTTICSAIRDFGQPVIFGNVTLDPFYNRHPTPAMYHFQSYVSVPIRTAAGGFFGTLCAIDPEPRPLDNAETVTLFSLGAELIAWHLDHPDLLEAEGATCGEDDLMPATPAPPRADDPAAAPDVAATGGIAAAIEALRTSLALLGQVPTTK